jgi:hypothetical protein
VSEKNCFWNKKNKGYRQEWLCKEMGIPYKPSIKFPASLGSNPVDSDTKGISN